MLRQFTNDISSQVTLAKEKGVSFLTELGNIWADLLSGALPLSEVFSFIYWRLTGK